jgi:molybdate transport system ATP-binding protein
VIPLGGGTLGCDDPISIHVGASCRGFQSSGRNPGCRRPASERVGHAHALLRLLHLNGLEKRRPFAMSGGKQQRVAVARALARDPDVLLLDEPFSPVDRRTRRILHNELRELRAAVSVPIILVTHDLDEAASLADVLCVLDRGEILQTGCPSDVLSAPARQRVREALDLPLGVA